MKLLALKPEQIVSYQGKVGVALYSNDIFTWFFRKKLPVKVETADLDYLSDEELLIELQANHEVRELLEDYQCIEIQERDDDDYLNYCLSYD